MDRQERRVGRRGRQPRRAQPARCGRPAPSGRSPGCDRGPVRWYKSRRRPSTRRLNRPGPVPAPGPARRPARPRSGIKDRDTSRLAASKTPVRGTPIARLRSSNRDGFRARPHRTRTEVITASAGRQGIARPVNAGSASAPLPAAGARPGSGRESRRRDATSPQRLESRWNPLDRLDCPDA